MLAGAEKFLHDEWHKLHRFHLNGVWLAAEDCTAQIDSGLQAETKSLYVPGPGIRLAEVELESEAESRDVDTC